MTCPNHTAESGLEPWLEVSKPHYLPPAAAWLENDRLRMRGRGSGSQGWRSTQKKCTAGAGPRVDPMGGSELGSPETCLWPEVTLSVAHVHVCGLKERNDGERDCESECVSYERESQTRGLSPLLLCFYCTNLHFKLEEKAFFLLVVICLRELENHELSGWMINGEKITFR